MLNIWDIMLIAAVAVIFFFALRKTISDTRKGKGCLSCGGSCDSCSSPVCKARREEFRRRKREGNL